MGYIFKNHMGKRFDSFKQWSGEAISDSDGNVSSKRIITFTVLTAVLVTWACDLFYRMESKEFIFEGLMMIVMTGLTTSVVEKFSLSRDRKTQKTENEQIKYDTSHLEENNEIID